MKAFSLALALLLSSGFLAAQGDQATVFRGGTELVSLSVVVTNPQQQFVAGLSVADFSVFEDGIQQDLSFFAASAVPIDLAILLDTSASMTDKIATVQQAAIGFVSTLRDGDRLTVVDIKDATRVLAPLSGDLEAAKRAILSTVPKGGTALYNGLYLTLKEMTKQRRANGDVRRQAIVVLSDGNDTTSLMAFDDVMALAKESGIVIYAITLRSQWEQRKTEASPRGAFSQSEYAMKSLAQETGARSFFPTEIAALAGGYTLIADELASQYALGYTSKNPKRDGAYRRVAVRIMEVPNVQTRTRSGYLAARAERAAP